VLSKISAIIASSGTR